jgi:hypothetical protein
LELRAQVVLEGCNAYFIPQPDRGLAKICVFVLI